MSKLAIIACISLSKDSAPLYIKGAQALIAPTRAEPGCELYGMAIDVSDPTKVWISEQWASQEALNNHFATDHVKGFLAYVGSLDVLNIETRQYDVTNVGPVVFPSD